MTAADRRPIDDAIDEVAATMVAVEDDPELLTRIVGTLPERSARFPWLIPQFAALSAIAVAAVVWSARERPATLPPLLPSTDVAIVAEFSGLIPARAPRPLPEPPSSREPWNLGTFEPWNPGTLEPDFDRALPALDVVSALAIPEMRASDLAAPAAIDLRSIDVAALALTTESFPPQKEE